MFSLTKKATLFALIFAVPAANAINWAEVKTSAQAKATAAKAVIAENKKRIAIGLGVLGTAGLAFLTYKNRAALQTKWNDFSTATSNKSMKELATMGWEKVTATSDAAWTSFKATPAKAKSLANSFWKGVKATPSAVGGYAKSGFTNAKATPGLVWTWVKAKVSRTPVVVPVVDQASLS